MANYDIYYRINADPTSEAAPISFGGGTKSQFMTGFYKTIFKWLKCLMTVQGSDLSDPNYGTVFASLLTTNMTSLQEVQDVCTIAVEDASRIIRRFQSVELAIPAEELLNSVRISEFTQEAADSIRVVVELRNVNNDKATLLLQVNILPSI